MSTNRRTFKDRHSKEGSSWQHQIFYTEDVAEIPVIPVLC